MKFSVIVLVLLAALAVPRAAMAQRPQVIPEPMLINLFALTEASAIMKICAGDDAFAALANDKKKLLTRLLQRIDGLVKKMATKFDDDLFGFYVTERDKAARNPAQIDQTRAKYGPCGDALFKRMQWYVYDSRQKLEQFLSEIPDAK